MQSVRQASSLLFALMRPGALLYSSLVVSDRYSQSPGGKVNHKSAAVIAAVLAIILAVFILKLAIGFAHLTLWFALLGIKIVFLLLIGVVAFAILYHKLKPKSKAD